MTDTDKVYTLREIALALGVAYHRLHWLVQSGQMPEAPQRLGRHRAYPASAVETFRRLLTEHKPKRNRGALLPRTEGE